MTRLTRTWLMTGIVGLGLAPATAAFGQASGQATPTYPTLMQPMATSQSSYPGMMPSFPRGGGGFPQGRQSLGGVGVNASPQYGAMTTPYGAINLGTPGLGGGTLGSFAAPTQEPSGQLPSLPGAAPGAPTEGGIAPGGGAYPGAGAEAGAPGGSAAMIPPAAAGAATGAAAAAAGLPEGVLAGLGREAGVGNEAAFAPPGVIGDQSPLGFRSFQSVAPPGSVGPPNPQGRNASAVPYPTVRAFKISENQSPRPQDRVYFSFNFYNNVNKAINAYDGVPITNMQAFRYLLGLEKTFDQGQGSIGVRFPINNLTADSFNRPGLQNIRTPTSTAVGNLDIYAKYILKENPQTGSLVSAGMMISTPTGPGRFAGAPYIFGINDVSFQPFLGYIYNGGNWYFQGFSGFYFPTILADNTLMYNDVVVGYYLLRDDSPNAWLSAVVPSYEVHVNTPFTHTDWHNRQDIAGAPTVVSMTWGLNFQFQRSAVLTCGYILPVTNPQPFTGEFALMLNVFYGRTRSGLLPVTPPPTL